METIDYLCGISQKVERKPRFEIIYLGEAVSFLGSLPQRAQDKIAYNIDKCKYYTDYELFKKLEGTEIWEFRTLYNGRNYRLFSFWDTDGETLVVATHGIVKRTQKTPRKEIEKARAIRAEWFNNKKIG